MHLLDSDTCIRVMRNQAEIVQRLREIPPREVFISTVTHHELYYRALHSTNPARHLKLLEHLADHVILLPFSETSSIAAAEIRESLAAKGTPIGPLDTLIAGHAIEHGLTLVTGNVREFSRVEGLPLENWDQN